MTVTQRQYSHLTEMGINVWRQRNTLPDNIVAESSELIPDKPSQFLTIDSNEFINNTLFQDVLLSINCSVGDVTFDKNTINLGLINWRFVQSNTLNFSHNVLTTPSLESLSHNIVLKRELWQILNTKVLS